MFASRLSVIVTLYLCNALVYGSEYSCSDPTGTFGPAIWQTSMITNYISADNPINGTTNCRMEYVMPEGANLWQGMLAANQQHGGNFTFDATYYTGLGHFITTVNGVQAIPNYFFALFAGNGVATSYGADSLYPTDGESYIWYYQSYGVSHTIDNYTGPCLNAGDAWLPNIPPSMSLTYIIAYLTVSDENTGDFVNGADFKPVCKQLVLFDASSSSLYDVLTTASGQVPLQISSTIVDSTVTTLNSLMNQADYVWTPYNATTNTMLPLDLALTDLSDGDHIIFRFTDERSEYSCSDPTGTFGPAIWQTSMITNYISADNPINGTTNCRMEYVMPEGANLWQGMLAASQQHGKNYTFDAIIFQGLGHYVTTVNGVQAIPNYFWALFAGNGVATSYGADSLYPKDDESYIWYYQAFGASHTIDYYTGPCLNSDNIWLPNIPPMSLTYIIAYLTVSDENTGNFVNGADFKPVCKQLVLFDASSSSLYDVLTTASDQVPLQISSTVDDSIVITLNNLMNQAGFIWTPYNATSNTMLPLDLALTDLSDGDHIIFRFTDDSQQIKEMTTPDSSSATNIGMSMMFSLTALIAAIYA